MIELKTEKQIDGIRKSCHLLCNLLDSIEEKSVIRAGISTKDIDDYCHKWIIKHNGKPACLHYEGFPAATCVSVNNEVIHGIPRKDHIIVEGDIVSVDLCINLNGYISDSARTYPVGEVSEERKKLIDVTRKSLYKGIEAASLNKARVMDIGQAVFSYVTKYGYGVVREYFGHGVGLKIHEDPSVPNYVSNQFANPRLREGMVFTIEPMINAGTHSIRVLNDGWTVVTQDGKDSAHFEHTLAVTHNGLEILTQI